MSELGIAVRSGLFVPMVSMPQFLHSTVLVATFSVLIEYTQVEYTIGCVASGG